MTIVTTNPAFCGVERLNLAQRDAVGRGGRWPWGFLWSVWDWSARGILKCRFELSLVNSPVASIELRAQVAAP